MSIRVHPWREGIFLKIPKIQDLWPRDKRLRPPEVAGHFRDDVETARACGARSKTHSPLISSRLMQRRACPAPTVGVGHARLFVTTRAKSSLGNVAWFSSHFGGPQAHVDRL